MVMPNAIQPATTQQVVTQVEISRDGYKFDATSYRWKLSRDTTVYLEWTRTTLSKEFAASLLKVLAHYATKYSADHTNNVSDRFRAYTAWICAKNKPLNQVTASDLINYREAIGSAKEWYIGVINGFLKTWIDLGLSGVSDDVILLLSSWRLKGNPKGAAVQLQCPYRGALSDLEYESLQARLLSAFEAEAISLESFVLITLFMATGRRPAQLGDLKCIDLTEANSGGGLKEFLLNVPRRKLRSRSWRLELKPCALTPEIGLAVRKLIQENNASLQQIWPDAQSETIGQLPLFPDWRKVTESRSLNLAERNRILESEEFHRVTASLSKAVKDIVSALLVPSERTGGYIKIFPTRLRRTLATRAAREGYGELVIAELLDHADTQNARVYTENVPEHVDAINEAMARQLAPIAQAFAGVLVDRESDARRGNDPKSRVRTDHGESAGTCGHFGFCGALAPIACYTCNHFQPWIDGSHEEVLRGLIAERDRIKQITRDSAMASINDRTIFAVVEVIQRCESRKAELAGEHLIG